MFEKIGKTKTPNFPNMHKKYLQKILKLKGYIIEKVEETDKEIFVHCHSKKRGMRHKGQYSSAISTKRIKNSRHIVIDDRVVILHITQRKFYFSKTDQRLWEILPDFKRKKRDTNTFREQSLKELRNTNYTGTSIKRHTSRMYPLRLLDEIDGFQINWDKNCTRIGLDGKSVKKHQMVMNITNLDKHEVVSVLPGYNQQILAQWCESLAEARRGQIKEICVDMSDVPIAILHKYFPAAHLIIDHFHVIAHAIKQMNQLRRNIQNVDKKNFQSSMN